MGENVRQRRELKNEDYKDATSLASGSALWWIGNEYWCGTKYSPIETFQAIFNDSRTNPAIFKRELKPIDFFIFKDGFKQDKLVTLRICLDYQLEFLASAS